MTQSVYHNLGRLSSGLMKPAQKPVGFSCFSCILFYWLFFKNTNDIIKNQRKGDYGG
jgi:hypothetical protein